MREAEIEVNSRLHVKMNDKERIAFKIACATQGREMSEVVREFIRDFVKRHGNK